MKLAAWDPFRGVLNVMLPKGAQSAPKAIQVKVA